MDEAVDNRTEVGFDGFPKAPGIIAVINADPAAQGQEAVIFDGPFGVDGDGFSDDTLPAGLTDIRRDVGHIGPARRAIEGMGDTPKPI